MKKKILFLFAIIIIVVFVILKIASSGTGNAFSWSWFSSKVASKGTVESDVYTVEMLGNDARLYSFNHKGKDCLGLVTSEGVGLDCKEIK